MKAQELEGVCLHHNRSYVRQSHFVMFKFCNRLAPSALLGSDGSTILKEVGLTTCNRGTPRMRLWLVGSAVFRIREKQKEFLRKVFI